MIRVLGYIVLLLFYICHPVVATTFLLRHFSSVGQSGCFVNNRSGVRISKVAQDFATDYTPARLASVRRGFSQIGLFITGHLWISVQPVANSNDLFIVDFPR